jgi:CRP-like cAMP-binding protein
MNALEAEMLMGYPELTYRDHATSNDWARVLATFPLFFGVSKRRLRKLVRQAKFVEFAPGDTIVTRHSPADALYVILGGTAKARGEFETRMLNIGEYFGDVGLLGGPGLATVVATGELHVMRVPRGSFVRGHGRATSGIRRPGEVVLASKDSPYRPPDRRCGDRARRVASAPPEA